MRYGQYPSVPHLIGAMSSPAYDHRFFDDFDVQNKRDAHQHKWTIDGPEVLPAWIAEHDFKRPPEIADAMHLVADQEAFGYCVHKSLIAPAYAKWAKDRYDWDIDPELTQPLVDCLQGVFAGITAMSAPDEAFVVTPPIYFPFLMVSGQTGREQVEWTMKNTETGWEFDVDELDRVLTNNPRVRSMLLAHPHNPTGRVMSRQQLTDMVAVAAKHDIVIISDEIHADIVFPGTEFSPLLTIDGAAERVISVVSAGKTFALSGVRAALGVFGNADLQDRFVKANPPLLLGRASRAGLDTTIAAWTHGHAWLDGLMPYLGARRQQLFDRLATEAPLVKGHRPEATYLAFLDVSACDLGADPADRLKEIAKVRFSEGNLFGTGGDGYIRFNFATSESNLDTILDRVIPHLQG